MRDLPQLSLLCARYIVARRTFYATLAYPTTLMRNPDAFQCTRQPPPLSLLPHTLDSRGTIPPYPQSGTIPLYCRRVKGGGNFNIFAIAKVFYIKSVRNERNERIFLNMHK